MDIIELLRTALMAQVKADAERIEKEKNDSFENGYSRCLADIQRIPRTSPDTDQVTHLIAQKRQVEAKLELVEKELADLRAMLTTVASGWR